MFFVCLYIDDIYKIDNIGDEYDYDNLYELFLNKIKIKKPYNLDTVVDDGLTLNDLIKIWFSTAVNNAYNLRCHYTSFDKTHIDEFYNDVKNKYNYEAN